MKNILCSLALCISLIVSARTIQEKKEDAILIFTWVYNRPDFIDLHIKTFNAFLKEQYRYVVFNDASDQNMSRLIQETCKKHRVECIRVPDHAPHRQSPGHRHMDGIKHALATLGFAHTGLLLMIDADMFLVKPFSLAEYMTNNHLIGGYQERNNGSKKIVYTSPCLVMIDMKNAPNKNTLNFDGDHVEGVACDVGGHSYYYFRNNPALRYRLYTAVSKDFLPMDFDALKSLGYDYNSTMLLLNLKREYGFEFHGDTNFIHFYAGGSNWPGYSASFIHDKTVILNNFVDDQIKFYSK